MKMFHFQFYHSISKASIDPNLSVLDTNQRFLLIYIFFKNWAIFSAPVHWFCTFQISFQHELHARTFRKSFHHPAYKTSCPLINYSNNKTQTSQTHPFPLCFHSFIYYHFFFLILSSLSSRLALSQTWLAPFLPTLSDPFILQVDKDQAELICDHLCGKSWV